MTIEKNIENRISEFLEAGIIEKKIEDKLSEAVDGALDGLLGRYGDLREAIEKKVKEAVLPVIENRDFSDYVTKLEPVLIKVLQETTFDNTKILENFQHLATGFDLKEVKLSSIFEVWCKYVAAEVNTDELEVDFDDDPSYELVECSYEVNIEDRPSWSSFDHAVVRFECEKDERLNVEFRISKWSEHRENWDISSVGVSDMTSLRLLNDFDVYMMKLNNCGAKLILDSEYGNDEVQPDGEPEASFS